VIAKIKVLSKIKKKDKISKVKEITKIKLYKVVITRRKAITIKIKLFEGHKVLGFNLRNMT